MPVTDLSTLDVPPEALATVCRRHHVRELLVFGSAARGPLRPDSDIDLLYVFEPGARVGWVEMLTLEQDLQALFGRRVDLVAKDWLHQGMRDQVLADARVLFAA